MALDKIRAPYNFVPLSDTIVRPDWADRVSHDVPFSDGLSGAIDLKITAETPLFIRGNKDPSQFFRLPGGPRGIPGSSLRGMLRSVVEIASFGRMERIADRKYGVRDLGNSDLYGSRMAERAPGLKYYIPLVGAGWLRLEKGFYDGQGEDGSPRWIIEPCSFAKVHYKTLVRLAGERGFGGFNPGERQSAADKYKRWGAGSALEVALPVEVLKRHGAISEKRIPRVGDFGVVPQDPATAQGLPQQSGKLVFTGQPMPFDVARGPKGQHDTSKRHDFFFYGSVGSSLPVSSSIRRDFEFIHSGTGQQHRQDVGDPNEEWGFWKPRLQRGEKVPVFFLSDADGNLESFGLAMMFRLAYRNSPLDLVRRQQTGWEDEAPDLADLVFGYVRASSGGTEALRGRVALETATEVGAAAERPEVCTVLGTPKASYYPTYIEQENLRRDGVHKTYMDDDAHISGWKRYQQRSRALSGDALPHLPKRGDGSTNLDVATQFCPVDSGATFRTRLRLHNLRPVELGAVLWCIDFGGRTECRHGLGLAKALGYGGVSVAIDGYYVQQISGEKVDLEEARCAFRDFMEGALDGMWEVSDQVQNLIALATPAPEGRDDDLRHMSIGKGAKDNEFAQAKLQKLQLPPAADPSRVAELRRHREENWHEQQEVKRRETEALRRAALSPVQRLQEEMTEARDAGTHLELLRHWTTLDDGLIADRKRIAREIIRPSKQWKKSKSDLWAWMIS